MQKVLSQAMSKSAGYDTTKFTLECNWKLESDISATFLDLKKRRMMPARPDLVMQLPNSKVPQRVRLYKANLRIELRSSLGKRRMGRANNSSRAQLFRWQDVLSAQRVTGYAGWATVTRVFVETDQSRAISETRRGHMRCSALMKAGSESKAKVSLCLLGC